MPKALVVDDDRAVRDAVRVALDGYEVTEAATAGEAMRCAWGATFDVVVLDVVLPDVDTAVVLRRVLDAHGVPVLVISGRDRESIPIIADHPDWAFLPKPFDTDTLRAAVRRLVRETDPSPVPAPLPAPPKVPAKSDAPPPAFTGWPSATADIVDRLTRRGLRLAIAVQFVKLAFAGKVTPEVTVLLLVAMVGVESAVLAWRNNRVASTVAAALPIALSLVGYASGVPAPSTAAATIASIGALFVDRFTSRSPL